MDIIVLILIVFFAVSVMIVARVIINRRKIRCEAKKEEEKAQKEQEKLAKKATEDSRKHPEVEAKAKEEAELVAKKAEDEVKKNAEEKARLATALKHEIEERIKAEEKSAEERLRKKEREEESLRKEEERLESIKAEKEKIEREEREASKKKAERERLEAEEKESKAEQEAKARKAEEEKARKEEVQEKEELERRLEGEEGEERQELPPDKRGGRPRGSTKQSAAVSSREPKPRPLKPEVICWNKGWEWIVGIEVPEEFESPRVPQNDDLLEQDNSEEVRYPLHYIEGTVKVAWTEGEKDIPIMKEGRNYLIFKMRRNWKGLGRLVNRPTSGYYLAIVPEEWKRDEEMSGGAPVAPENVQLDGYKAHFFGLRQNGDIPIAFIDANGERIQVEFGSSRFQLVGNEIFDSSDDIGPLFGEEPPRIKTIDEREWNNVGVVVVGEEGSGRNRWRMQFFPQEGANEQHMPDELTNRRGGWYFVRIYDKDDDLLESMDFRFIAGLRDIQIMNSECLPPSKDGYNDVIVQFINQNDCKVELKEKDKQYALEAHRNSDETIITIPPKPDYDKTRWILCDGNAEIEVTVLIERVWWCIGQIGVVPIEWVDKPFTLSRKDFTAITDKALWVKLPRVRWLRKIDVGFNCTKSRSYNVEVEKKEIAIPLRDFCDAEEILNPRQECLFQLFIGSQDQTYSAQLIQIHISFRCKKCEFTTRSDQETLSHITVHLFDFIPHLSYEELYQRSRESLPPKIYKCSYCNFYVSADDPENPTSTICSHIERNCQKTVREVGRVEIRFRVVSDIDEIRDNVIATLPHIYQCRICNKEFQGDDRELRLNHLQENHKDELFEIF
jgi:hypothetical protein